MKKFNTFILESKNRWVKRAVMSEGEVLNKNIDEFPEGYQDVLDMLKDHADYVGTDVKEAIVSQGFVTISNLKKTHSVTSVQMMSIKNARKLFPTGMITEKWIRCMTVLINFNVIKTGDNKELPEWATDQLYDKSILDKMTHRFTSTKTLANRIESMANTEVKVSIQDNRISLLIVFNE